MTEYVAQLHDYRGRNEVWRWYWCIWKKGMEPTGPVDAYALRRNALIDGHSDLKIFAMHGLKRAYRNALRGEKNRSAPTLAVDLTVPGDVPKREREKVRNELRKIEKNVKRL